MIAHALTLTAVLLHAGTFDAAAPGPRFHPGLAAREPAPPGRPAEKPFFLDAAPRPLSGGEAAGPALARMSLASQLDRQLDLLELELGGRIWQIGAAGDAAFQHYYLTFRDGASTIARPLDLGKLTKGIEVEIAPGIVYSFRLSLSVLDPFRKSTLRIRPVRGTRGRSHDLKSGQILDAIKAKSFVFSADGSEYWSLYGHDVDPATGAFGATRSLLFVHFAGMDTNAWPLSESSLAAGQPTRVQLVSPLVMTRDAGELAIASGR